MSKNYEIERKYLIAMPDAAQLKAMPGCVQWDIAQTYLTVQGGFSSRVRKIVCNGEMRYFKTEKVRINAMICEEKEGEISESEYEAALKHADPSRNTIFKTRYRIPNGDQMLEIDVFPFWKKQAVLEIELRTREEIARIPETLKVLKEVTDDMRYKNSSMTLRIPEE